MSSFSLSEKMKRKDLDDEFAEFSIFSPAKKSRRLDAELLSISEEKDSSVPYVFNNSTQAMQNDERALVVYKPKENPLLLSPGDRSDYWTVNSDFIIGLKNNYFKSADRNLVEMDERMAKTNNCLAVVPWLPSQGYINYSGFNSSESQTELTQEPMEDEEPETKSMEVEELKEQEPQDAIENGGLQHWQQHCMTPGIMSNAPNSIMWSWTSL